MEKRAASMASVLSKAQVWPIGDGRLLPSVRPITTLLATGIVWVTGLLVACSIAAGYLRQQVLTTTADELRRLDTVVAAATTRSLQDLDPVLESLADRLRRQGDAASLLQQAIGQSQPFDAIALIGADGTAALVGAPIADPGKETFRLPIALRIAGDQGAALGAIIAMVPVTNLTRIFETVPLAENTAIALLGADGRVLARYPRQSGVESN